MTATTAEEVMQMIRKESDEAMNKILASDGFVTSERADRITLPIAYRIIEDYVSYRLAQR